jgi:hypothetical protein
MQKPMNERHLMKSGMQIGATLLVLAATSAMAEENSIRDSGDLYRAKELSLDAFGSASLGAYTIENPSGDRIEENTQLGAGLGLNYFFTRNIGIGADAYSEDTDGSLIDSASASLLLRFPLGKSGFAPYIFGGGGRQFDFVEAWFAQAGAGMEYRFTRNIGAFVDARWVLPDETKYYGVGRLGMRFSF